MSTRFLLISGELPGEGVWCQAATYEALVARVHEVWGNQFNPIFKYTLSVDRKGAEEDQRYYDIRHAYAYTSATQAPSRNGKRPARTTEPLYEEACREGGQLESLSQEEGRHRDGYEEVPAGASPRPLNQRCFVIVDDEQAFQLWRHGGGVLRRRTGEDRRMPTEEPHSKAGDTLSVRHTSESEPLTRKLFAFRKTAVEAATGPMVVVHTRSVTRPGEDNSRVSAHPYHATLHCASGVSCQRSSPAVKSADATSDDVTRVPMHALVPPLVLLRLGVRVVLRHSNASEVILFSTSDFFARGGPSAEDVRSIGSCPVRGGCLAAREGSGLWGELVQRARSAWGVHRPVFCYLDLSLGYQQIFMTNVKDLRHWCETVGAVNPELLVLEMSVGDLAEGNAMLLPRQVGDHAQRSASEGGACVASAPSARMAPVISLPSLASATHATWGTAVPLNQVSETLALQEARLLSENVSRFRAAQPPQEVRYDADLHRGSHLRTLMARLDAMQCEELQASVCRPRALPSDGGSYPRGDARVRALTAPGNDEENGRTEAEVGDSTRAIAADVDMQAADGLPALASSETIAKESGELQRNAVRERWDDDEGGALTRYQTLTSLLQRMEHRSDLGTTQAAVRASSTSFDEGERSHRSHTCIPTDSQRALPQAERVVVASSAAMAERATPTRMSRTDVGSSVASKANLSARPAAAADVAEAAGASMADLQTVASEHHRRLAERLRLKYRWSYHE